jgi:hypothetical protein
MPFKSQAQRRKFAELLVKGEISDQTFEEWNRETGSKAGPDACCIAASATIPSAAMCFMGGSPIVYRIASPV